MVQPPYLDVEVKRLEGESIGLINDVLSHTPYVLLPGACR